MNETSNLAAKRLLKKLSALRATLRKDEYQLLDDWLSNQWNEVTAHKMSLDKAAHRIVYDPGKGKYLWLEA